jgi:nucleoside-diphosphate-sugar epimerase
MNSTPMNNDNIRKNLSGERILLVGGAGFIGHHLALSLRSYGADVMVSDNLMVNHLVNHLYSNISPIQRSLYRLFLETRIDLMRDAGVHLRNHDARTFGELSLDFDEFSPHRVVHLAAISSAVEAKKNPGMAFDLQLNTLRNTLELVRLHKEQPKQIMLLSSSTVYGDFSTPEVNENTRPQPKGLYANIKYMSERLLRAYRDHFNIGCTIIRPSALYGERCVSRRVSQVFIENALSEKPLPIEGGGQGKLDFTSIHDLIDGMVRALAFFQPRSNTYNITFGHARSIADIANIVREVVPNAIFEERPAAPDKPIRGTLSNLRAREQLGFSPSFPIDTAYKLYCETYKNLWHQAQKSLSS